MTTKGRLREQWNNLSRDQKRFLKVLAILAESVDLNDLDELSVKQALQAEGVNLTNEQLRTLATSLKCIH